MTQHLEQAHYREIADVGQEPAAFALEPVAPEAEDLEGTDPVAEVADEVARVEVARRLAARNEQPRGRGLSGRGAHVGGV